MSYYHLGADVDALPATTPAATPHTASPVDHAAANALALTLGRSFTPGEMTIIADHMAGHASAPARDTGPVTADQALQFMERACRNWPRMPKLSPEDITDVARALTSFRRSAGAPVIRRTIKGGA